MIKKTKIVATLGPASGDPKTVQKLIEAGVDVFRLNLSHGSHEEHIARAKTVRKVAESLGQPIGIFIDLCGPKIRTGDFEGGFTNLVAGTPFLLTTRPVVGNSSQVSVSYKRLPKEVSAGCHILLDDGRRSLLVKSVKGEDIMCEVEVGGEVKNRRGVNVPDATLSIDCLTEKDRKDLFIAKKIPVDFVALSFVRRASDVLELKTLLKKMNITAGVIAKIETAEAVKYLSEIVEVTDALMVARGDLAVEFSPEEVPLVQKKAIELMNSFGKPVITATQMLDSMVSAPVPTRAEVSDIANAILDGTDAVMLSNESAVGAYPIEAVKVMSRVALRVESDYLHRTIHMSKRKLATEVVTDAVTASAVLTAEALKVNSIVALTMSGRVARMLSRHKPGQIIYALSPNERTASALKLSFGVVPIHIKKSKHFSEALALIRTLFVARKWGKRGDRTVVVCGFPFEKTTEANLTVVEKI